MIKWRQNRIEQILVSNSGLVSGLPEASGVRLSRAEVSQESLDKLRKKRGNKSWTKMPIEGILKDNLAQGKIIRNMQINIA